MSTVVIPESIDYHEFMFGLGWMEIAILLVLLVLIFGADKVVGVAGRLFGTAQKLNDAKRDLTDPGRWLNRLTKDDKSDDDEQGRS